MSISIFLRRETTVEGGVATSFKVSIKVKSSEGSKTGVSEVFRKNKKGVCYHPR
jgi:hypothetical protein